MTGKWVTLCEGEHGRTVRRSKIVDFYYVAAEGEPDGKCEVVLEGGRTILADCTYKEFRNRFGLD